MNWYFFKSFKQISVNMLGNYLPHVNRRIETKLTSKGTEQALGSQQGEPTMGQQISLMIWKIPQFS